MSPTVGTPTYGMTTSKLIEIEPLNISEKYLKSVLVFFFLSQCIQNSKKVKITLLGKDMRRK